MIKLNGVELFKDTFPNGEVNLKVAQLQLYNMNTVDWKYTGDEDFMHLYLLKKEIDALMGPQDITLNIAYLPYSRMDRRVDYLFSLKHVCKFINDLGFSYVRVLEPHSNVATALLDRCHVVNGTKILLQKVLRDGFMDKPDVICFPDSSAAKRYHGIYDAPTVSFEKHRDFETGKLTSMELHGELQGGEHVVIVDDLCSAGGTFQWAADILKGAHADKVSLLVTHCETAVLPGLSRDSNQLDLVVTTDTIIDYTDVSSHPQVYIYGYKKVML